MKTITTFKVGDDEAVNKFLAEHRYEPGTINYNPGSDGKPATVSVILEHDAHLGREISALEDNLHTWKMKLNEARVNKAYWMEQKLKEAKNPNKEIQKTIDDNLKQADFNIEMNQSQIHAIENLIQEKKSDEGA